MSSNSGKSDDDANALLGDLESIRSLLDENDEAEQDAPSPESQDTEETTTPNNDAADDDVPVLDDVIDGALKLNEAALDRDSQRSLSTTGSLDGVITDGSPTGDNSGLSDDLMSALLDDDWRARAENLLQGARQDIENNREDWQPEYTDELTDALQVRIDATVHDWIGRTLSRHVDELRHELVNALSDELGRQISSRLGDSSPGDVS